jgi:hypothetical protein
VEEHCDQQEIFLSDLLSILLPFGHQEALLVFPQLCHHSTQQEARSLEKEKLGTLKQKSASVEDINIHGIIKNLHSYATNGNRFASTDNKPYKHEKGKGSNIS